MSCSALERLPEDLGDAKALRRVVVSGARASRAAGLEGLHQLEMLVVNGKTPGCSDFKRKEKGRGVVGILEICSGAVVPLANSPCRKTTFPAGNSCNQLATTANC